MATQGQQAGYVPATREIQFPGGGGIAVRGLSLPDIMAIYKRHAGELGLWFERLQQGGGGMELATSMVELLLTSAPVLACEIIAAAADVDDPVAAESYLRLPLGVQMEALQEIADLTFTSEMPPKKVVEIVIRMAAGMAGSPPEIAPIQT